MIYRNGLSNGSERVIKKTIRITGTGTITINFLQVTGNVRVIEQYIIIKSIISLTNATSVYSDVYDGTNTKMLTDDGAVLSGVLVGSKFTKDKDISQIYSVSNSSQVRVNEVTADRRIGKPFTITQKNGADTFIRLHLSTTDTPIDFTIGVVFKFERLDSDSNLIFL